MSDGATLGMSQRVGLVWVLSLDRYEVKLFLFSSLYFILPIFSIMTCFFDRNKLDRFNNLTAVRIGFGVRKE